MGLVAQSCLALFDPMAARLCPWDSPGKNTGVDCHALLQGIFPTQESNPRLPHCRRILLPFEPPGKPKNTEVGSLGKLCWTYEPTGVTNALSEWNLIVCRGLTVLYK